MTTAPQSFSSATATTDLGDHSRFTRIGFLAIALSFGGFGGWAAFAPIDSAAIAPAQVAVDTSKKPLQHWEGGIVREILAKEAQVQRAQVLVVQKELNDQKLLATNNRIEADAQTAKARRLLDRVEELERNVTQLTNKIVALGGERGGSTNSLLNPPPTPAPRDVRGTVMAVGTGGLTIINIGSDSGLSAGNKLLVYRVDAQNPKNSIYLGEMIVSRTEPKQAAGQFYAKPFAKPDERLPQKGDVVATSLGSR